MTLSNLKRCLLGTHRKVEQNTSSTMLPNSTTAQPPHHGTGIDGSPAARLHLHTNHHLQTACRNVGASLIFTIMKYSYSLVLKYLPYSSGGSSVGLHAVLGSVFCFPLFHTHIYFA